MKPTRKDNIETPAKKEEPKEDWGPVNIITSYQY
jgi:hypothetical protein